MHEGGLKNEATGSTRFHNTMVGSVRSFYLLKYSLFEYIV